MNREKRAQIMAWVGREILPHEADVRAWLLRTLDPDDLEDVIQETYCQIAGLKGVSHIASSRAYFFTAARSIVLMRLRRARVVSIESVTEIENTGNRYNVRKIELSNAALGQKKMIGRFRTNEPDAFAHAVEMLTDSRAVITADRIILSSD